MLGWGILGCGDITEKRVAPAIAARPSSRLIWLQSRTAARAAELAARCPDAKSTGSRAEVLADPEVGAVYVATEHHRHAEDVIAAAEAGKHVLCEKPLANSVADCLRMIEACRANGVALQVAYYRRYYPKLLRMQALLEAGAIGEPVSAQAHLSSRLDPRRVTPENWRLNAELSGGGALVDTGSHRLDLLCWLLGEPDRVAAFAECRELPIEAPDTETLLIRFRSGVHAVTRHGFRSRSRDALEINGTQGALSATPVDGPLLSLECDPARLRERAPELLAGAEETPEGLRWHLPKAENVHLPLIDDFTRRIAAGEPPRYSGEDGMQASRIIEAAYESARTGRVTPAP
ncbi:MAG: Gfo/Idh/MocA family protein [Armatimonadota bacterium]